MYTICHLALLIVKCIDFTQNLKFICIILILGVQLLLVLHLNFYVSKPLCTKITLAFCQQGQLRHGAIEDFTKDLKNEVALRQDVFLHKLKPCSWLKVFVP